MTSTSSRCPFVRLFSTKPMLTLLVTSTEKGSHQLGGSAKRPESSLA